MNKKGFTLIELLAVLVILSIVSLFAIPAFVGPTEKTKKSAYMTDASTFITSANYMYVQYKLVNDETIFRKSSDYSYTITLDKLEGVTASKDPYGYYYDTKNSFITFTEPTDATGFKQTQITFFIKSCSKDDETKCHCISGSKQDLSEDLVDGACLNN